LLAYRPNTPILIGECAPTREFQHDDGSWGLDAHNGWMHDLSPQACYGQLLEYDGELQKDAEVSYATPFTLDGGQPWIGEYDTSGLIPYWTVSQAIWQQPQPEPPIDPTPPVGSLVHPLPGSVITQHFYQNPQNYAQWGLPGHNGTDFGGKLLGTPIACIAAGVVVYSAWDEGYGWYLRILHDALGICSFYAHLNEAGAPVGTVLSAGQTVGLVGSTGNSTGPHLHLEIRCINADGSYAQGVMPKGRVDPESWTILHNLKL
jgi:murein DD-endopeptidase MepM/ murein hydrolase activator NlpD